MIQITCKGNSASCTRTERLTSGMVGLQCEFVFDSAWDGLAKTAVFQAGSEKRDVLLTGALCTVPWEVLKTAGYQLVIGVYGSNAEGTLVIPTVYAMCGSIAPGADPSGEESIDPTLPVWGQMQGMIGNLAELATTSKDNLVAAINEAAQSGGGGGGTPVTEQTVSGWGFTKNTGTYSKPSGGIPKTDLADDVQASLSKANSALQEHQDVSGKQDTLIQSGAAVGQIAKITAVDDTGKPTAWEPVDMPRGGGGDTLLYHYDTSEDAIITSTALVPNLDISTADLLLFKWHINGYGNEFGGRLMINNQPITKYFPFIHRKAGNTIDIFCLVAVLDASLTVINFIADSNYRTDSADLVYVNGGVSGTNNVINITNSGTIESFGIQGATVAGAGPQDTGEHLDYTTSGFSVDVYKVG